MSGPFLDLEAFTAYVEGVPDATVVVDAAGIIRLANTRASDMFGYPVQELLGAPIELLVPDAVRPHHPALRAGHVPHGYRPLSHDNQVTGRRRDGELLPVEITLAAIETDQGPMRVAAVRDVSEKRRIEVALREAEERYRRLAEQDPLTGLFNRRRFEEALLEHLASGTGGTLLLLDVDRLKRVNDSQGHRAGDLLLAGVGQSLAAAVSAGDLVARIGGDEFAVLLATSAADELASTVSAIVDAIAALPISPVPTVSMGYVLLADLDESERTLEGAIGRTDVALYRAKREGRNRHQRG